MMRRVSRFRVFTSDQGRTGLTAAQGWDTLAGNGVPGRGRPRDGGGDEIPVGILICGLNGSGKSTLGKVLSERIGYTLIDNEDLFFPREDRTYIFSSPRSREEAIRILEEKIAGNRDFVFAAVKGDYGDRLLASLDHIVLMEVPREIRRERVRERSLKRFAARILPGGDLYEKEEAWFALTDSRPEDYTLRWLESVDCPVIRLDGTLPPEENTEYLLSIPGLGGHHG